MRETDCAASTERDYVLATAIGFGQPAAQLHR
jgi:hypothetical protein